MNRRLLQILAIGSMFAGDAASVICGVEDGGAGGGGGGGGGTGGEAPATATPAAAAAAPATPDPAKLTSEAQLALAKEAGFESVEEMKAVLAASKKTPAAAAPAKKPEVKKPDGEPAKPAAAAPAKPGGPEAERTPEQLREENDRLTRKLADLTRQGKKATREAEEAKLRLSQVEAEMALRDAARKAGIVNDKNANYAIYLLREALAPLSDEDVQKFNEDDFFNGLKEEHPFLFGVVEKPATTTTQGAGGAGSAPPKPESAAEKHAAAAQFNGLTASTADIEEYMRKNFPGVRVRN